MTTDRPSIPRRALHLSLREDAGKLLTDLAYDAHTSLSDVVEALVAEVTLGDMAEYQRAIEQIKQYVRMVKKGAA